MLCLEPCAVSESKAHKGINEGSMNRITSDFIKSQLSVLIVHVHFMFVMQANLVICEMCTMNVQIIFNI